MHAIVEALRTGNLVGAARSGAQAGWHGHAALALIGAGEEPLRVLAAIDDPEARIFHALGLWIAGDEAAAADILGHAPPSEAVGHLRALLQAERIRVLAFLPPHKVGPHSMFASVGLDPRFKVECVWFEAEADGVRNRVDASIQDFYRPDAPPDLMICEMVEWHVLPRDLGRAPFMKVGHTSDFDIHGQELLPWLKLFDVVLTLDDTEWSRLRHALPNQAVLNYPKLFAIEERRSVLPSTRPIDVLMTGTVYADYHHDKNELIARVAAIPDINCVFLNGFVSAAEYAALTRRSKLTLSYVRHSGTMPTRALESLGLGTWPLIQEDSVLRLYLGNDASVLPYAHGEWGRLAADVRSFVHSYADNRDSYQARLEITRARAQLLFTQRSVASQYLRFCAALPAIRAAIGMPAPHRAGAAEEPLMRRGCVTKGWLPAGGDASVMRALMLSNKARAEEGGDAEGFNRSGRESLIEYARLSSKGNADDDLLTAALTAFERAIAVDPAALAPRFNLLRAGFHFGDERLRLRAKEVAEQTLRLEESGTLRFSPTDDVLPYDFYPSHFHAQQVCDLRLEAEAGADAAAAKMRRLIVASVHFYLASADGLAASAEVHYRAAIALDPEHVHFKAAYAEYLLAAQGDRRDEPMQILRGLAVKAWTPRGEALMRHIGGGEDIQGGDGRIVFFDVENEIGRDCRYRLARSHDMRGELLFGRERLRATAPPITALLCGSGWSASPRVHSAIRSLRNRLPGIEIAVVDTSLNVQGPAAVAADILLSVPQPGALAYSSKAIDLALRFVRAPVTLLFAPELSNLDDVVEQIAGLVLDREADRGRLMLFTRDARYRDAEQEILCVVASTERLKGFGMQRIGMLQAAPLALPLVLHKLRSVYKTITVMEYGIPGAVVEPTNSGKFDLIRFASRVENETLRIVSPDWRRFTSERGFGAVRAHRRIIMSLMPSGSDQFDEELEPTRPDADRYDFVIAFDYSSVVYRLTMHLYRRLRGSRRLSRLGRFVIPTGARFTLGPLHLEHSHLGLVVKMPIARVLARRLTRARGGPANA